MFLLPSQDMDLLHHMSWSVFMLNDLRCDMVVSFVDNDEIIDHASLCKLSFHNISRSYVGNGVL